MSEKRIRVLHVEDNPADARLTREFLSEETSVAFDVECVNRISKAVEPLTKRETDVILLDLSLPDCQGLETFYRMRALAPDIPIVVETGMDDEQSAVKAVQEGAQDYLIKSHIEAHTLRSALRHAIERKEMQDKLLSTERLAAVAQMMTGLAHDFETLLDGIIGYTEILGQRHDIPETAKGYIEAIGRQSRQAAKLLHKLLDSSQRVTGSKQPLSLLHSVEDIIASLRGTLPEGVHVAVESDSTEAAEYVASADPLQIRQALTNLATFAGMSMPDGGELSFRLTRVPVREEEKAPLPGMAPGTWISLAIADSGKGIKSEDLPHIFEPFFTTENAEDASGLDLAQVYGIVRQHGGFIDVSSKVDEGTTFTVYLPALLKTQEELDGMLGGESPEELSSHGS